MSDRHAPVVLARIWRVQLVVMIGCLEGTATQRCADLRRRTSLASETIESSRSMGDLHRRPTVGILRRKGSEPIQLGGTVGTTGYCAQDAEPCV